MYPEKLAKLIADGWSIAPGRAGIEKAAIETGLPPTVVLQLQLLQSSVGLHGRSGLGQMLLDGKVSLE